MHLRNVKAKGWNHQCVYRMCRELDLNLRIKPRRQLTRERPDLPAIPTAPNDTWSMDVMADQLGDGCSFQTLNVGDDFNLEGFAIEANLPWPVLRVTRTLDWIIKRRGKP